jgi:hypothetical protein
VEPHIAVSHRFTSRPKAAAQRASQGLGFSVWLRAAFFIGLIAASHRADGSASSQEARGEKGMITAAQALEIAHGAIVGKAHHDTAGSISVTRQNGLYTVTFSAPRTVSPPEAGHVIVDATSRSVRDIHDAPSQPRDPALRGFISAKRAFDIALGTIRDLGVPHDERWETTVVLQAGRYLVTFPLEEAARAATRRADYALQVVEDARTGKVLEVRHAS